MAFVIIARMEAREEEIPMDAAWAINIAMVMGMEIAAEEETVINTGMDGGIKIHLYLNHRSQTIRISPDSIKKEAKIFLNFRDILAFSLFLNCIKV